MNEDLSKTEEPKMKETMPRICFGCGGNMPLRTISRVFKINGKEIEIREIEAYVCEECGREIYTGDEAKKIERLISKIKEAETE